LRLQLDLPDIPVRWHNKYFNQPVLEAFLEKYFEIETRTNIGNLYYIISRVVYAKMAQIQGQEPDYGHVLNELASKLPSLGGYNYSPNMLYVLRKK
jgi:hypothetical protein